ALAARTRLELSGAIWLPERDRYLVVSDDTGWPDQSDGAPWVFGMSGDGRLDPDPWPIAGLAKVDDLEAVTRAPDGALWLAASQSVNRKGKRGEARALLARVEVRGTALVATGSTALAHAIGRRADQGWWERLGLAGRDPRYKKGGGGLDRRLDVEGLAWLDGALLIGLKHPLDEGGRALIWRLTDPDRVLATGGVGPEQLSVWARVPLGVGPGGSLPAGFADLLRLDDGRLLALATAIGDADEGHAERGLHSTLVAIDNPAGTPQVEVLRAFTGLHAEGLAQSVDGTGLVVVFDRGQQAPMWAKLARPERVAPPTTR
ncbi:MAG: hypothetical protein FJ100_23030, partial [Deltaproteobacteria bacterium]|nr:hypothetical protein [Deltaproteobacteria bacterium]